jgi:predicted DCC family thiol-disulfide oxidoreductase YuxK
MSASPENRVLLIVYDGDCYFCRAYVNFVQLRQAIGAVELLSARSGDARLPPLMAQGFDLDDGMLIITGPQIHAGADAMHWLAVHLPARSLSERLHAAVFRQRWLAQLLYPLLRLGRRAWLALRGVPPIRNPLR